MTKAYYKLIAKLYSAVILHNVECAFNADEVLPHTTEDQLRIIAEESRRLGKKMAGKHDVLGMSSIDEIAEYVESLYYE